MTAFSLLALVTTMSATPVEDSIVENIAPANYIVAPYLNELEEIYNQAEGIGEISIITASEAIVRQEPSMGAEIVEYIAKDTFVIVTERIDNYYKIERNGSIGYIFKDQLNEDNLEEVPHTKTSEIAVTAAATSNTLGDEIVAYAKQFLGNPYVYGGNSLTKGVDCSGFVQQVMKNFGISVQRSSRSQYASDGYKVTKAEIQPGDLVFYGYNGNIDHVAIYIGGDQIIHASTPKTGICISKLSYGKPIIGIKRVI